MMVWTEPRSWAAADIPIAADLNTHIRDNQLFLYGRHGGFLRTATAQPLASGVWTTISFELEDVDVGGLHNTAADTDRITIAQAGRYAVVAWVEFASSSAGTRAIRAHRFDASASFVEEVLLHATQYSSASAQGPALAANGDEDIPAGHFLRLQALQTAGVSLNVVRAGFGVVFDSLL